jgi:hypothetical protein
MCASPALRCPYCCPSGSHSFRITAGHVCMAYANAQRKRTTKWRWQWPQGAGSPTQAQQPGAPCPNSWAPGPQGGTTWMRALAVHSINPAGSWQTVSQVCAVPRPPCSRSGADQAAWAPQGAPAPAGAPPPPRLRPKALARPHPAVSGAAGRDSCSHWAGAANPAHPGCAGRWVARWGVPAAMRARTDAIELKHAPLRPPGLTAAQPPRASLGAGTVDGTGRLIAACKPQQQPPLPLAGALDRQRP